ncbi:MAG: internal scaffolding protein [Microvirus sp.]|nr:MAG: internal scaffolding protein [Microvirus sp.]
MKKVLPYLRASTYAYDTNQVGDETGLDCKDQTLTQQHMKDECDINVLVKRFVVTGEIPTMTMPPMQGDFTDAPTYQDALNLMVAANQSFMQQPADIRARFDHDPGKFVNFCSDEKNRDELRRMGLWSPEASAAYELQAQTQADLDKANAEAAKELKELKKLTPKGVS